MKVDGKKLRDARGNRSIEEIAVAAGLSARTIARKEKDGGNLNLNIAKAIAAACNVPLSSLAKE